MAAESAVAPGGRSCRLRLRPGVLGVLLLTAAVTLASMALALLAPLRSTLRGDRVRVAEGTLRADAAQLAAVRAGPAGAASLGAWLERFSHGNGATYAVWSGRGVRMADSDRAASRRGVARAPRPVLEALSGRLYDTPFEVRGGVLDVAVRYAGRPVRGRAAGTAVVLEMIGHLDVGVTAGNLVRDALLDAALAGLGVAIVLGIALSSAGPSPQQPSARRPRRRLG